MLLLSRKVNESIKIGNDIEIMVIEVRDGVTRLGITAPQSTQIWRKELWEVIVNENKIAANASTSNFKNTPQLPLSTFSKLSKIPTVHINKKDNE